MTFSSRRLALGMDVCHRFETERPRRRWSEQVLPYALAKILLIAPSGWTLTECVLPKPGILSREEAAAHRHLELPQVSGRGLAGWKNFALAGCGWRAAK